MPSPSLILESCTTLISMWSIFSVFVDATTSNGYTYTLSKQYAGSSFFDEWDFFNGADPNNGFVTYLDQQSASSSGLIDIGGGDAFLKVDSSNNYNANTPFRGSNGHGRPSVRIESRQSFHHGLIIANFKHMPSGCGTWPAFWALGTEGQWPNSGEVDILEGVNNRQNGLAALHTGGQCKIAGDARTMTGALQSTDCRYDVATGQGAVGCTVVDTDSHSYGGGLNAAGGSVFAVEWTSDAIKIWSFPGSSVPADIVAGQPDPSIWGLPAQVFNGQDCNIDNVIKPQKLIINTNFCGDFGEAVWSSEGCAAQTGYDNCASYVANNPDAFTDAFWQIGYLRYFQRETISTTSSPANQVASDTTSATTSSTVILATTTSSFASTTEVTAVSINTVISDTTLTLTSVDVSSSSATASVSTVASSDIATTSNVVGLVLSSTTSLTATSAAAITLNLPSTSRTSGDTLGLTRTIRLSVPSSSLGTIPATSGNTIGPVLISSSSSSTLSAATGPILTSSSSVSMPITTIASSMLTTGSPQGSIFLPPMGSGVPITLGWNETEPVGQWERWTEATSAIGENTESGSITLTKTWIEPCETGYTTKTTYLVTTYCGCTETPKPTIPMRIITTECPEAWGFQTPVVFTIPNPPTATWSTWPIVSTKKVGETQGLQGWSLKPTSEEETDGTLKTWPAQHTGVDSSNLVPSWTEWLSKPSDNPGDIKLQTWTTIKVPVVNSAWVTWSKTRPAETQSTWRHWQVPTAATETPARTEQPVETPAASPQSPPPQAWDNWDGSGSTDSYVGKWTGTAPKTTFGAALVGLALAVVALIL